LKDRGCGYTQKALFHTPVKIVGKEGKTVPPSRYSNCGHLLCVRTNESENTRHSFHDIIRALPQLLLCNSYKSFVRVLTSIADTLQSFRSHISRTATLLSTLRQHHGPIRDTPIRAVQSRRSPRRGIHLPWRNLTTMRTILTYFQTLNSILQQAHDGSTVYQWWFYLPSSTDYSVS